MPPRKPKVATVKDLCIYLVEVDDNGEVSEEAHRLVRQCVIDKIFAENPDHIAICRSDMISNVEFVPANWDALRKVESSFREPNPTSDKSDSISILLEICEIIKTQNNEDSYISRKILFFGHLNSHVLEEKQVIRLGKTLQSNSIAASFILTDEETMNEKQAKNAKILKGVLEKDEYEDAVFITNYNKAKKQIMNTLTKRATRPSPWNVAMEIGPDIKINVSGFVCTRKSKIGEMTKVLMKSVPEVLPTNGSSAGPSEVRTVVMEVAKNVTDKETIWKEKNGNIVDEEDVGRGYYYGDKLVPFNEIEGEDAYRSGEKCLKVLVFCPPSKIKPTYQQGDGTTLFYARREDTESELKFDALLKALHNMERVAIVRKVYLRDKRVNVGVLSPDMERKCLVFSEICFADDVSVPHFPPIFKEIPTEDEGITPRDELIDELITSMAIDEFNPSEGPVNPAAFSLRENVALKILGAAAEDKKPKPSEDTMDIYFEKIVLKEDLTERLKEAFPLKLNKEEGDRPSGANIFRKRHIEDEDNAIPAEEDKKIKLEEAASENGDKESGIGASVDDVNYDDMLDDL